MLGTATLDTMGGLVTNCNPQDLPEGASPRCWDVDYIIGSVFTRAGLQSVYTYTNSLQISALNVYNNIGTFTYSGPTPTVNEGFVLSGFNGFTFALNGQIVYVISVDPIAGTFIADVTLSAGTYTLLTGIATSTVGEFLGPNVPTSIVTGGTGNAWLNPLKVMGSTGYATVVSGSTQTVPQVPLLAGSLPTAGATAFWVNPTLITSTGAHVTLTAGQIQDPVLASRGVLAVPSNATVTGVKVSFNAQSTAVGTGALVLQLADGANAAPYGTPVTVPLGTTSMALSAGSASYQWGTTLLPALMSGNHLAVLVSAAVSSGTATVTVSSLTITVTYTLGDSTEAIVATGFVFAVPATTGLTGFGVSFQAYTSASSSVILQLLKNGVPVGQPIEQALTTTPTIYEVGGASILWGSTWLYSDVNNTQFGVQITATGTGITSLNDLDMLAYISPSLVNFNYVKSYIQNDDQTYTLALDAAGIMWVENVTSAPNALTASLSGILPGSFASSATMNNREHICFSDLSIGTERPRVFNGTGYRPLSQTGPGAPPTFVASTQSSAPPLAVTDYAIAANVVTFTFTATANAPIVGALYTIEGTGNSGLDGTTVSVIATPAPSVTQFSAGAPTAVGSAGGLTASATPTSFYSIAKLTQDSTLFKPVSSPPANYYIGEAQSLYGQIQLWSSGPGQRTPGNTITFYYGRAGDPENAWFLQADAQHYPIFVLITDAQIGNGLQLVTSHSTGLPPSESGKVPYFTIQVPTSNYQWYGGVNGTGPNGGVNPLAKFQVTMAKMSMTNPVFNLDAGSKVTITGATPAGWNSTWTILAALNSGQYAITSSKMGANGVVTFTYNDASGGLGAAQVSNGQPIELQGLNNPSANLNTVGIVSAATPTTFQVAGFPGTSAVQSSSTPEDGQGTTFGTDFLFEPGLVFNIGSSVPSPIFGDSNPSAATVQVIGGTSITIGPGVRQGVCYFITDNEYETQVSSPFTFTVPSGATGIVCSNLPIGPSNVIARGLAFTEAGQNGVPGANFYVIEIPVTTSVGGVTVVAQSTVIHDNTTSEITLSFTDAVLLKSREIDVQGDNLFNLIELGSSAWDMAYSGRMFYGLQLNKIDNWQSGGGLTFDGGHLIGSNQPLGWSLVNTTDQALITSPVTGQALYIKNVGAATANTGMIYQTAYQDAYLVPIISTNTTYSVRVACSAPSGLNTGTLTIDLTDHTNNGFGTTYGSFSVPLSSMTTNVAVFDGNLLTVSFPNVFSTSGVSPNLQIRVYVAGCGVNADCLIDRIEVYPTNAPYLKAQVYGSYPGKSESIDGSATGGIIDTTSENTQAVMGAFVMHDILYLMKTSSWYSTQDNPNSEPGGWGLHEVSNKVGTIGIYSYDTGEEWCITACRSGIYGFDGGQPTKISQEMWNLWEQINWNAGNTIVLRNDVVSKRLFVAIPLPTGVNPATGLPANKYTHVWLPNAPYNPTPTSPNVMLMLNYQGLADIKEMMMSPEVHTTMFGTLAAVDMKRKWTIWNIATPYMAFIMQPDGESTPLYICNGINTSKIYKLNQDKTSDDGRAINSLYTTYGFVNAAKATTLPIFGFHAKRYTVLQTSITGTQLTSSTATNVKIRILQNTLTPKFPYTVPIGIPLVDPANDDYFRPINVRGNRAFIEVSSNAVGSAFNLSKLLLTGKADPWSTLNPTGGGNTGIV